MARAAGYVWPPTPYEEFRMFERALYVRPSTAQTMERNAIEYAAAPGATNELMNKFVEGRLITVSRDRDPPADLKKMIGVDEIWTLAVRKPGNGRRFIGRFMERDAFVILHHVHRDDLNEEHFQTAIEEWRRVFPGYSPLRAENLTSYLSGGYRDLDDDPL
jgi:hypothetical protein